MIDSNLPIRDRPVFICGHPKSGTSLLRSLLDSHPQLVVYPEETVFFREVRPLLEGRSLEEQLAVAERRLIHVFEWDRADPPPSQKGFPDRDYTHVDHGAIRRALHSKARAGGLRHDGDLLSAAVLAFGEVSGSLGESTSWWVEKSPYNEYFTPTIFEWWPAARCIHIVRDPRDNYLSYRRKHPEWSAEAFATSWRRSTRAGLRNRARFGADRYLILSYDLLVKQPEENLAAVRDFLGIAAHESLTVPTKIGDLWRGNSMFARRFQGISTASVGRWRERLPPLDAEVIEMLAGRELAAFRFPRSDRHSLGAYLRVAKWHLHRVLIAPRSA